MKQEERAAMQQALNVLAEASGLVSEYKGCHSRLIEAVKSLREALAEQTVKEVPDGYALVSVDALKAWGKYDEVRNACQFPAEQAEQKPVACPVCCNGYLVKHTEEYCNSCGSVCVSPQTIQENVANKKAAHVRTKDLTDDELAGACGWKLGDPMYEWVVDIGRWAIAADRSKNGIV